MTATTTTIMGTTIQHDASGVGHCWRTIDAGTLPETIREEIAAEMTDGAGDTCPNYVASNGLHYRW